MKTLDPKVALLRRLPSLAAVRPRDLASVAPLVDDLHVPAGAVLVAEGPQQVDIGLARRSGLTGNDLPEHCQRIGPGAGDGRIVESRDATGFGHGVSSGRLRAGEPPGRWLSPAAQPIDRLSCPARCDSLST